MSAWHRDLGSFPTRRSSDLSRKVGQGLFVFCMRVEVAEVLTWFASRRPWRNHQSKRAEKPHSKLRGTTTRMLNGLQQGRRLRLPWPIASGSWQPRPGVAPNVSMAQRSWLFPYTTLFRSQPQGWAGTVCFLHEGGGCRSADLVRKQKAVAQPSVEAS